MEKIKQGYKQTDIGLIPEDWNSGKIRNYCSMKSGNSITSENITLGDNYPCYGGNGLRGYTKKFSHEGKFTLIGRQGALCGNVRYVEGKFFASEHAIVTTPLKGNDIKLLSYMFERMNLNQYTESSAQPGLSVSKILDLPFNLPINISEQTAIATALSDTDALIAALDKKIAKKQQIKQGAMQQLLTGKKRLPGFSGEWVEKKIFEVGKVVTGSTPSRSNPDFWNGDFVWVSAQDFKSKYIFDSKEKITEEGKYTCRILPPKSVLVTCIASIGLNALSKVACATNQQINSVVCNSDNEPEFLYYQISNNVENLKMIAGQTAVPIINKGQFEIFTLMFPNTKSEQTAIAQILTDMDNEIVQLEKERDKYKEIKAGMMQVLLTGRVRLV
jgi:type I restriction enzyme S subunit